MKIQVKLNATKLCNNQITNSFVDIVVPVRRKCYPQSSPAGKGARWECAGSDGSQEWHPFDMDIQCLIEEAWARVSVFRLL